MRKAMYVKVLWFLFSFHLRVNETSYEQLTWNVAAKPFLGILGHRFPPTLIEFPQWGAIDLFVEADLLLWSTATVEVDESGSASNKMKAIEMMMKGQHPVISRVLSGSFSLNCQHGWVAMASLAFYHLQGYQLPSIFSLVIAWAQCRIFR